MTRRRCAVLGHPIRHSLSPVLHRTAYARLGLDWTFEAVDVTADRLAGLVLAAGPAWRGLALTKPLKRAVLPLLDSADDLVRVVGAANTLLWEPDGSRRGANTDVPGLVAALAEAGAGGPTAGTAASAGWTATVLGGGATAAAAVVALAELGVAAVTLRARDPRRATEVVSVAERVGIEVVVVGLDQAWTGRPDVLLSTVPGPVAMAAVPEAVSDAVSDAGWGGGGGSPEVVADLVYDPWPSPLLARAAAWGASTVSGVDLLAHQAALQVALMTGQQVPVDVLRDAAHRELATRAGSG